MEMKHTLLIITVFLASGAAAKPSVFLVPPFPLHRLFVDDEVTLVCVENGGPVQTPVTWYLNRTKRTEQSSQWKISNLTTDNSGQYACRHSSEESDELEITVLDMVPLASLSFVKEEKTVLRKGDGVLLRLYVEEGLQDWWCAFEENFNITPMPLSPDLWENNNRSVLIHADVGHRDGRTFWCMNLNKKLDNKIRPRSNSVKLTSSGEMVVLQMSHSTALEGENITLTCEVWGGAQVDKTVLYKDGKLQDTKMKDDKFVIKNITKSVEGEYYCNVEYRFTHISKDAATHTMDSQTRLLMVKAGPPEAHQDCGRRSCSCPRCQGVSSFRWYYSPEGRKDTEILDEAEIGKKIGVYTCAAKLGEGQSRISNACLYKENKSLPIIVVVLVVLMVLFPVLCVVVICKKYVCKKRVRREGKKLEEGGDGGYEEVGKKGEYELLNLSKEDKEKGQYETLPGQGKGQGEGQGGYEALKLGKAEAEVYHTLGEQGQGEGQGGYEALKLGKAEGEVYHTLGERGQGEGQGGYEALKLGKAEGEVYHTLGEQGQGEGQGGYEALKLGKAEAEVYHTLKDQAQGKGEYEALKTTQAEVYHTLEKGQGAGSVEGQKAAEESPYEELKAVKKGAE